MHTQSASRGGVCLAIAIGIGLALAGCGSAPSVLRAGHADLLFNVIADSGSPVRTDDEPFFNDAPIFDAIPGRNHSHAATITTFPDGELLAAWYSYVGPDELNGSAIYTARRPAGSDTWDTPTLHIDRYGGDGNPVLYSEGDRVWMFQTFAPFGWNSGHVQIQDSFDRGHTWSRPRELGGPIGSNVRYPPVRTATGKLLLPAYDDWRQRTEFFVSDDGDTWTLEGTVTCNTPYECIQPTVVRLGTGRLLAVMRNVGQRWLWVMASDDDGQTWSTPIDAGFPNPGSATALLRLSDGGLVLVYNDDPYSRRPLAIALSADEGVSWPYRRVLIDGDGKYSYPAAVQTPDGRIHIVYTQDRERIHHIELNTAWIIAASPGDAPTP